ncbi:uridine kinase, partial [Klebsiella pneumoniae]
MPRLAVRRHPPSLSRLIRSQKFMTDVSHQ